MQAYVYVSAVMVRVTQCLCPLLTHSNFLYSTEPIPGVRTKRGEALQEWQSVGGERQSYGGILNAVISSCPACCKDIETDTSQEGSEFKSHFFMIMGTF